MGGSPIIRGRMSLILVDLLMVVGKFVSRPSIIGQIQLDYALFNRFNTCSFQPGYPKSMRLLGQDDSGMPLSVRNQSTSLPTSEMRCESHVMQMCVHYQRTGRI